MDPAPANPPAPATPPGTRFTALSRTIFRTLRVGGVAYLCAMALVYWIQEKLIFPGALSQGRPDCAPRTGPGIERLQLTTPEGEHVAGIMAQALDRDGRVDPEAARSPTILYFYGNGMCLADSEPLIDRFRRLGFNVISVDYLGYGASSGKPSERGCRSAALAAYDEIVTRQGVDPSRLIIVGWSLGGAVAIDLASRKPAAAVAVFSSFTSMAEMSRLRMPIFPVSMLLRHPFDSIGKIRSIQAPFLIGHGRQDSVVPFAMGPRLAQAAAGHVETLWIEEADHNDFFDFAGARLDQALDRLVVRSQAH